ncbi:hypothetical protein BLD44_007170 [Mastigocladus laminosus UU774]|nr:hypothetical protein BLD44_007170 [Mastigocladus laminosus UU774]
MPRKSKRRAITCVRHTRTQLESNGEKTYLPGGSWLEQFWCSECQSIEWYLVQGDRTNGFTARLAQKSEMLGSVSVDGNPSVSEYSKRCSRGGYGVLRYV